MIRFFSGRRHILRHYTGRLVVNTRDFSMLGIFTICFLLPLFLPPHGRRHAHFRILPPRYHNVTLTDDIAAHIYCSSRARDSIAPRRLIAGETISFSIESDRELALALERDFTTSFRPMICRVSIYVIEPPLLFGIYREFKTKSCKPQRLSHLLWCSRKSSFTAIMSLLDD